jgi:mono/diheme cytochrome c family protein
MSMRKFSLSAMSFSAVSFPVLALSVMHLLMRAIALAVTVFTLAGCVGDGDTTPVKTPLAANSPDAFLLFPNTQAPLAAGTYSVQLGPQSGSAAGNYTLTLTWDDGHSEHRSGSWPGAGTATESNIVLTRAGGLTLSVASASATHIVLSRQANAAANIDAAIIKQSDTGVIALPLSQINSDTYAQAYYAAVDPAGERATLAGWKQKNGFGAGYDTHVIFRDAKDLGYGRDMFARRNADGTMAVYVNNYIVALQPGSSTNYGPLNVEAAIAHDARYLIGSNAIEFSPANQDDPLSANGSMVINKFFTFDKNGNRVTSADLDGRGRKSMPGTCWACHGGQPMPLDPNGAFPAQALRSPKFNLLDPAILEYSAQSGYQRAQLEAGLKMINSFVHESLQHIRDDRPATTQDKWSADFAINLVEGRYALTPGDTTLGAAASNDSYIPDGWKQNPSFPSRPVGVEQLYKQVVEPHCVGCHSVRGTAAGEGITVTVDGNSVSLANAINFSSYEKFIAYKSRIADYVYRRGLMPMSLRNFESFWKDPRGAPSLLASFLNDASLFDVSGNVIQPGLPVAKPGAALNAKSPLQLDGNASYFADTFKWVITSGPVDAVLSNANTARPVLTTTTGGAVTLALTVTNSRGSNTASVIETVDNTLTPAQGQLTFANDIAPILNANPTTQCAQSCHKVGGTYPGIPVYWTNDSELYHRVMMRVDLRDPENSKLLLKPTSLTHGGAVKIDVTTSAGQAEYNTILNWIRQGAVCGTGALCPTSWQ